MGDAIIDENRDEMHSSCGRVEGAKELRELSNVPRRGIKEDRFRLLLKMRVDYNEGEGRPHLDENGIHDARGSWCQPKLRAQMWFYN